jgi:hypothetical protein
MPQELRRTRIREIDLHNIRPAIAIPAEFRCLFRDGYDAPLVFEVGAEPLRGLFAITSGREISLPRWFREALAVVRDRQKVSMGSINTTNRPVWLDPTEHADSVTAMCHARSERPLYDQMTSTQRREIAIRWLHEEHDKL